MAKPTWLSVSPASGSGNGTIKNTGTVHTGRVARTGEVTVTAAGVAAPVKYKVTQKPKTEFVQFGATDAITEMAAEKTAGKLTINGKTNSSKLTFAFVGDAFEVTIPTSYQAAGKTTNNGTAINGDPGATAEFNFSITLDIPLNDTVTEVNRTLKVTAAGSQVAQIVIKQASGDARIELTGLDEENGITLEADGTAVNVGVVSNTTWTVA